MVLRISVFAKCMELFTRNVLPQSQALRTRPDPLAGTNFTCRIVIVLLQMLVEILLCIGQAFLCNGSKHTVRGYPISAAAWCVLGTMSFHASADDSKGRCAVIVRPLGTIFRRKQNGFAKTVC